MKLKVFLLLFVLTTPFLYLNAQNSKIFGVVEYSVNLELGLPVQTKSQLYFDSNRSTFIEGDFSKPKNPDFNSRLVYIDTTANNKIKYFTNLKNGVIYKYHNFQKGNYLIRESLFNIDWKLHNQFKDILDYKCQKATGTFRGRNYTAWFTTEIPVSLGPWKLNGLPGLILQAEDDEGKINFRGKKIVFLKDSNSKSLLNPDFSESTQISLKEYLKIMGELEEEEIHRLISTMPKGSAIRDVKINGNKTKMEGSYEWEKN